MKIPRNRPILCAGYTDYPLIRWLEEQGETVITTKEPCTAEFITTHHIGSIISYGYRP